MAKGGGSTRTVNSRKASASRTNKVNNDAFSTNMLTQKEQETYDRLSKVKNKYSNVYESGDRYEKADARKADGILYGYHEVRNALIAAGIQAERFLSIDRLSSGYHFSNDRSSVSITFGNRNTNSNNFTPEIKSFLSALTDKGFKYTTTNQMVGMGINAKGEITVKIKPRKRYSE